MTDRQRPTERGSDKLESAAGPSPVARDAVRLAIVVGALGVVFGDIGTSPIYTIQTVFNPSDPHPVPVSTANVLGVVSLVFWSVVIIVTVTYLLLAMRADNDGEGGIMALITLLGRRGVAGGRRTVAVLTALGIFGAALFFGDGMITPAISVLSAVEGLKVINPSFDELVVPITTVIIVVLFLVQRRGTAAVGSIFGPVMILWFGAIAAFGVLGITRHPDVLKALSPAYALDFLADNFGVAFFSPAAVVLAVTGAEAEGDLRLYEAFYFLSKIELQRGDAPTMAPWRKRLFTATSYITADAAEHFNLPRDRTVIMGSRIDI